MNFSTLKGLTIPEGVVTEIKDASGRVLWSGDNGMRTVTITGAGFGFAEVTIDDTFYNNCPDGVTLVLPIGTEITCYVQHGMGGGYPACEIIVNGVSVASGGSSQTYIYTLASNVNIELIETTYSDSEKYSVGTIVITEQ